ncbi:MAG: AtpZ/AtpI family protein [Anaerolineae bacterium]|nr:AtpZ/AtpI family protein [Anaerolineae bacterium]
MSQQNNEQPEEETGSWGFFWREAMQAMSLGWELAVPIFAGVLGGHLLDRWLGAGYIFTMGFLVLGIAVGYYNVARTIRRIERRRSKEDKDE